MNKWCKTGWCKIGCRLEKGYHDIKCLISEQTNSDLPEDEYNYVDETEETIIM